MNVGQVLEVHLGWAGKGIGQRIGDMLQAEAKQAELRRFLDELYNKSGRKEDLAKLSDDDVLEMAENLAKGVPFATPVFDGASEEDPRGRSRQGQGPDGHAHPGDAVRRPHRRPVRASGHGRLHAS